MKKLWIGLTLLAALMLAFAGMASAEDALTLNEEVTVEISIPGDVAIYPFTPQEDGMYVYSSRSIDEEEWYNVYGYLLDEDMQLITKNIPGIRDGQFRLVYQLSADTQYYFGAAFSGTDMTGSFKIKLEKLDGLYAAAKEDIVYAELGQTGTAEVNAFSLSGGLTYQWFDGETEIEGETGRTYAFPALTEPKTYRCAVTDAAGQTEEVEVHARINSRMTVSGTGGGAVEYDGSATLSINANARYGADQITYAWYEQVLHADGIWYEELIEGETGNTLTMSNITRTRSMFCNVADIYGNGQEYWFNVFVPGKITMNAVDGTEKQAAAGDSVTMAVNAVSENDYAISYNWYKIVWGGDNEEWEDWVRLPGENDSSCTIDHVYTGCVYACQAVNSVGNSATKYFSISMYQPFCERHP